MKALILAAGFGTRLRPHTLTLPKPLFTVNNRPLLDLTIDRLLGCGCEKIFINTHHLPDKIRTHVLAHPAQKRLKTIHEPEILDTGGAIANLRGDLKDDHFFVINADIICDADLASLAAAHKGSRALATLLVHDCQRFNKVAVAFDRKGPGTVAGFDAAPDTGLAFTGIQVVSPEIFSRMPDDKVFSSIDLYKALIPTGRIRAVKARSLFWQDMGTPETYTQTSRLCLAGKAWGLPLSRLDRIKIIPLAGDGSDRAWFRASQGQNSMIIGDHGICLPLSRKNTGTQPDNLAQLRAFVRIGAHLKGLDLQVPGILGHDEVSGQVALEDLGDTHLADLVPDLISQKGPEGVLPLYKRVIDNLIDFSQKGIKGFNPDWTCQTPAYSKSLIMNFECRYFIEAFVNGYLGRKAMWEDLEPAFSHIADHALSTGLSGLMHRDMQSKNIMVSRDDIRFIDFQSARIGPIQYDLASLFIDPYVKLPQRIQDRLLAYAMDRLGPHLAPDKADFRQSFEYCCITRNLQILGAFGFLTRVKNKTWFESHIPHALAGLKRRLKAQAHPELVPLTRFVNRL